jgi:signal transduction histidine kinase
MLKDKKFQQHLILGFGFGAILLTIFSAVQKASLGVDITLLRGYIVPFIFGGCSGGIIMFLSHRWKKDMDEKLALEKKLISKLDSEVKQKTLYLETTKDLLELMNDTLTHDISNDLSVIRGNINLYFNTRKESLLKEVQNTTEKSITLVEKMRKLERIIGPNLELKPINLRKILLELTEKYSLNITIEGNSIVVADEMLSSVMDNLIRNVRDHANTKNIEINIDNSDEEFCIVIFHDDGVGIPKHVRTKIFQKGFKSGKTGNLGLGLYIVKKTLERYGGSIELTSTPPKGTTYKIKLKKEIGKKGFKG